MIFNDSFTLKGHVDIWEKKVGQTGSKLVRSEDNVITDVGKNVVIDFLHSGTGVYITHFGVGSGTVAESTGDTDNQYPADITSAANPHKVFDSIVQSDKQLTFTGILNTAEPSSQPVTLSEIGLFSAISGGSMFGHVTHTPYSKTTSVELKYEYRVKVQ